MLKSRQQYVKGFIVIPQTLIQKQEWGWYFFCVAKTLLNTHHQPFCQFWLKYQITQRFMKLCHIWSPFNEVYCIEQDASPPFDRTPRLTMITSMGIGTGSLALYLSFSSFTTNTTAMITMDMTRSQMLVLVILPKTSSRVCAKETLVTLWNSEEGGGGRRKLCPFKWHVALCRFTGVTRKWASRQRAIWQWKV